MRDKREFASPLCNRLILKNSFDGFHVLTIDYSVYLSVFSLCEANDCLKSLTESNCLDISPDMLKGDKV